eukprot:gb/GEZN01005986.1/.p1 GENE.gb/GEZN01005986.1/~~gb/GEZN01005986.1/.p1  ORF type:complete len:542 (+),score=41.41 gb/GEZN01005986.1/:60-1685(+)
MPTNTSNSIPKKRWEKVLGILRNPSMGDLQLEEQLTSGGERWASVRRKLREGQLSTGDPHALAVNHLPWHLQEWRIAFNPFLSDTWVVTLLLALLIVFGTGQKVFFKLMLFPMEEYVFLINQVQVLFFIPLFYIASWIHHRGGKTDHVVDEAKKSWRPINEILLVGMLEFANMLLQLMAGSHLPGALQVLLAQVRIPVTMIMSYILLGTKYVSRQYFGVLLTFVGILTAILPSVDTKAVKRDDSAFGAVTWSLVLMFAAVPSCLANVTRESVLHGSAPIAKDPFRLGLWISVCQFLFGVVFLPVLAPLNGLSLQQLPGNFKAGVVCWLWGVSTPPVTPDPCVDAPFSTWAFLISNFMYNLVQMLVFRYASASIQIVATTLILPLSAISFTSPWIMGSNAKALARTDVLATLLIATGVVVYKSVIRFNIQYFTYSFGMTSCETRVPMHVVISSRSPDSLERRSAMFDRLADLASSYALANKYSQIWRNKSLKSAQNSLANLNIETSPLMSNRKSASYSSVSPVNTATTTTTSTSSSSSHSFQ